MRIHITSIPVDDQEKAFRFYTEKLGFVKKTDIPAGEYRWLTVVSPEEENGVELLLEPLGFEPTKVYQKSLLDAGIPYTSFAVTDMQKEKERLESLGIIFTSEPTEVGPVTIAVINDTCGNLVQLIQL